MTSPRTHHTGVTVADLDRSVRFYRGVFGFEVVARFEVSGDGFATGVGVSGASGSFAHLDAGDVRLELVEYDPEDSPRSTTAINRPGATHLGFTVEDVDEFHEGLPENVETISAPRTTETGTRILFLRDPDGTLVEVLQTDAGG